MSYAWLKRKKDMDDGTLVKKSQFREAWDRLKKSPRAMIALGFIVFLILVAIFADVLADYQDSCVTQHLTDKLQGPSAEHIFGTDDVGRDLFGRVVHGTRVALEIGFGTTIITLIIGVILGCTAAFYGWWVDNLIMRITDILSTIPPLVLSMAIVAGLGNGTWQLMVAIGAGQIAEFIRLIRAKGLSVANMEFIESGRALGAKNIRLIFKYLLPNVVSVVLIQGTVAVARAILTGATLSFIGLGVKSPTPEWGAMLQSAVNYIQLKPYQLVVPGVALVLTSLSINTFGDCLRDALDPQLKGKH